MIKIAINGAAGRMGREVLATICREPDLEPAGAVDLNIGEEYLPLPDGSGLIPFSSDLASILTRCRPAVLVDFTAAPATVQAARIAAEKGVHLVTGTTGLTDGQLAEIDSLYKAKQLGAIAAANFSLGAVLLMHLAQIAGRFFDFAEVIELHHEKKADAPSGTAIATAQKMVASRGKPFSHMDAQKQPLAGTRGGTYEGVAIHSVRLPGLNAHQEVIFGGLGQTLTIRHDSISRESFMPGVVLAIREVGRLKGLTSGIESLLDL